MLDEYFEGSWPSSGVGEYWRLAEDPTGVYIYTASRLDGSLSVGSSLAMGCRVRACHACGLSNSQMRGYERQRAPQHITQAL